MNKLAYVFLAVAMIGTAVIAADNPMVGGAAMFPTKNIVENAVHSADHTTLGAAVKAAGLVETLPSAGPFTVFWILAQENLCRLSANRGAAPGSRRSCRVTPAFSP
jgi:hypothetical protein